MRDFDKEVMHFGELEITTFRAGKNGKQVVINCASKKTKNGFRHDAECSYYNGERWETTRASCRYLNRTWEAYTYQSVILKVLDKAEKNNPLKECFI